jgi:nucleoid DNA-binding protein
MTTRTERFQRKPQEAKAEANVEPEEVVRFSPEEEAVCSHKYNPHFRTSC